MPDLDFTVESVEPQFFAAAPLLEFHLRIQQASPALAIQAIALRCQIRIEPTRRRYSGAEAQKLVELFGPTEQWQRTLRSMLWTHASTVTPPFVEVGKVDLPVPCTYDFNVAVTKYFHALGDGDVPLCLLFSGTIFHEGEDGRLQVAPISWEKEANFAMPVAVWKRMMDHYYPQSAWLTLHRDTFDKLYEYKCRSGLPTWEGVIGRLLDSAPASTPESEGGDETVAEKEVAP